LITKEILDHLRSNQQKPYFGSEAKAMFVNGEFNPSNWNGGDGLIRQWTEEVKYNEELRDWYELNWKDDCFEYDCAFIVNYSNYEDMNYVTIILDGSRFDGDESYDFLDTITIAWYKSRGKTDHIKYNAYYITEDQYILLLNLIEKTGFKFVLNR
jgi:hypothetical protein